eukprot:CAMPEP_0182490588 /NCGR_PEP_ID=MMETSP1321-20130603/394_1 /TAXON_ID=91990 /ORGANISM="Bolidomonas sp., Strain RCC1657" /LENGTH=380 /DNA_ID=CAMNT_0024692801 /DNA_START=355 /DNA_END=1497 /DNA_ORIENTATION=-
MQPSGGDSPTNPNQPSSTPPANQGMQSSQTSQTKSKSKSKRTSKKPPTPQQSNPSPSQQQQQQQQSAQALPPAPKQPTPQHFKLPPTPNSSTPSHYRRPSIPSSPSVNALQYQHQHQQQQQQQQQQQHQHQHQHQHNSHNQFHRSPSSSSQAIASPQVGPSDPLRGSRHRGNSSGVSNLQQQSPSLASLDASGVSPPLFERLVSDDVQELKSYSRLITTQNERLATLERVNDDLERRLERMAKEKMRLEAECVATERHWAEKYAELENERDQWKKNVDTEQRKNGHLREQIYRKDKELHRILQRKYDGGPGKLPPGAPPANTNPQTRPTSLSTTISPPAFNPPGKPYTPQDLLEKDVKEPVKETVKERRAVNSLLDFFGM